MKIIKHDYNGSIVSQDADGYVSLTDMSKASGKLVGDYLRLNSTQNYLDALSSDMGIPTSALVKVFKGGNDKQGTWAHPEIAIDFAQWCSPQFRIWANRTLKNVLEKRGVGFQHNFEWFERLKLYRRHTKIPTGWFSIFEEMCSGLMADFEDAGYSLPIGSVPDISVGRCFCQYLREKGYDTNSPSFVRKYQHRYPDDRIVDANIYCIDLLPMFRLWFERTYVQVHLVKYLKSKDRQALPSLCKMLGLPEGSE